MRLRSKYYTYPVIIDGGDFYVNSSFNTDVEKEMSGYDIKFIFTAKLVNPQLQEMLKNNKVSIVHHIECPQTCYRTIIRTNDEYAEKIIPSADINGVVQTCSFLVANENLTQYTNDCFSSDYQGFSFDINKGCVLAIGNQIDFTINKIHDDLANTTSIFSIMPNMDESVLHMQIDTMGDKIAILLPPAAFHMYTNTTLIPDTQRTMHQMIIVPALVNIFAELKASKGQLYEYEGKRWFRNLSKACEKIGFPITEDKISNIDALTVSQLLLDSPLIDGMKYFTITEDDYEN